MGFAKQWLVVKKNNKDERCSETSWMVGLRRTLSYGGVLILHKRELGEEPLHIGLCADWLGWLAQLCALL